MSAPPQLAVDGHLYRITVFGGLLIAFDDSDREVAHGWTESELVRRIRKAQR